MVIVYLISKINFSFSLCIVLNLMSTTSVHKTDSLDYVYALR